MLLRSWLADWLPKSFWRLLRSPGRQRVRKRSANLRIQPEALEQRYLLTTIDLDQLGPSGVTLFGADAGDHAGYSIANVGDVNGDGFDDVFVSAKDSDSLDNLRSSAGEGYLVFGSANPPSSVDLATLGSGGVTIFGFRTDDHFGHSVSSAGDVNGDGYNDLLISAIGVDVVNRPNTGEVRVLFGKASWPATMESLEIFGEKGMSISGADAQDGTGSSVAGIGDFNGDGYDDIVIGASAGDGANNAEANAGDCYVIFGRASPVVAINLAGSLASLGIKIVGGATGDKAGVAVSSAGDVNGDGFDDFLIGAPNAFASGTQKALAGRSYLILGTASPPQTIDLTSGANVTFRGADAGDYSGRSLAGVGDVNGDGFDDLLIGAPSGDGSANGRTESGESYLYFGKASLPSTVDLASIGTAGTIIFGAAINDKSGRSVSGVGDLNGDGYDDLVVGGEYPAQQQAGHAFVIFGGPTFAATIDLANANSVGVAILGADAGDTASLALSRAGDVNGDGFADLLIGSPGSDGVNDLEAEAGEAAVVFGGNFSNAVTHLGTSVADTLTGTSSANVISGGLGNDILVGAGGADVIYGGQGDDIIAVSDFNFRRLDGGNGADTLRLDGSGLALNLTTLTDNKLANFETIDIRGSGANTLTLSLREVLAITGSSNPGHTSNTLMVRYDSDDSVSIGTGWIQGNDVVKQGLIYQRFTQGGATLLLHQHITTVNLSSLDEVGTTIIGVDATDEAGYWVADAGDVNGDGLADMLIGARRADAALNGKTDAGEVYLVFGFFSQQPMLDTIDLETLGSSGVTIFGLDAGDELGRAVSSAGDVNGDGYYDLLVGAPLADGPSGSLSNSGETYVIFGGPSLPSTIDLATASSASITIYGADAGDQSGSALSSAGDVNGDGYDDLLVGASFADGPGNAVSNAGETYLIFGGSALPSTINLASLGTRGVTFFGIDVNDYSGVAVSGAGDVNGDGFDDVVIGANRADGAGGSKNSSGETYIVFGASTLPTTINLVSLGSQGLTIFGADADDQSGISVSDAGDVNGDGYEDIIIGARNADGPGDARADAGEAYVVLGRQVLPTTLDLANLGSAGMTIFGVAANALAGRSVSTAGDFNADGFDDLLVGAYGANSRGAAYLVFGAQILPTTFDLALRPREGVDLLGISINDKCGYSVSTAGDVDGDGYDDLLIGAPGATGAAPNSSYLIFGGNQYTNSVTHQQFIHPTVIGDASANVMHGDAGDQVFVGNGGEDVVYSGFSDDVFVIPDANFRRFDGGTIGIDTLRLSTSGFTLDLTSLPDNRLSHIEMIDIRGSGPNMLILDAHEVLRLTEGNGPVLTRKLIVLRDKNDTLDMGPGWTQGPDVVQQGTTYQVFNQGIATLLVNTQVTEIAVGNLGLQGITIYGADANDRSGYSVSNAGDVNGDGYDDVVIGAPGGGDRGEVYVVFGGPSMPATINLANLGSAGVAILGADSAAAAGVSVSAAGDVNGDGFADIVLGATFTYGQSPNDSYAGESYVVFGSAALPQTIDLTNLGSSGIRLIGDVADDRTGSSVSGAGDVNGDGYDDVIVGAMYAGGALGDPKFKAGKSYVVFGGATPSSTIDLGALGSAGMTITGVDVGDRSGTSVSSAGDLNGDGYADLFIGAKFAFSPGKTVSGESYVVFGKPSLPAVLDLANLGTAGVTIFGADDIDLSGTVSNAGDVNGDGFDDIIIGAYRAFASDNLKETAGESYVIFGKQSWASTPTIDLANLGNAGITIFGAAQKDYSGLSVSAAGDVNADGFDDLLVGAPAIDWGGRYKATPGESYVVFGASNMPATIDLATLEGQGIKVFGADPVDHLGWSVSGAGDVNGDGFDDFMVGAKNAYGVGNAKPYSGETYIIFGGNYFTNSVSLLGTSGADTFVNDGLTLVVNGGPGNDTLTANFGGSVLYGGGGDDVIQARTLSGAFQRIAGGSGFDTFRVSLNDIDLNFLTFADNKLTGIECLDLRGVGSNTVLLNLHEVMNLTDAANSGHAPHSLMIRRDSEDIVKLGPGWTRGSDVTIEGVTYIVATQGPATVLLEKVQVTQIQLDELPFTPEVTGTTVFGIEAGDRSGFSVSNAGDLNGDGYDDLFISAAQGDGPGNLRPSDGESYVVWGGPSLPRTIDLATPGSAAITIYGRNGNFIDGLYSVSSAGDVNGDGYDDLILGAPGNTPADVSGSRVGESYLIFGGPNLPAVIDLEVAGSVATMIVGVDGSDRAGASVSAAGDVNGDGFDDLIVGAPEIFVGIDAVDEVGEAYIVFGAASMPARIDMGNSTVPRVRIFGGDTNDLLGCSVSAAGDVNGDGLADVIVGARLGDSVNNSRSAAGESYIIFGSTSLPSVIAVNSLGSAGVKIFGATSQATAGFSVSDAGDVNGDGYDDVIIGAPESGTGTFVGGYLVFGGPSMPGVIDLASLGTAGVAIGSTRGDECGLSVSGGGDLNADGFDDLIIGAPDRDNFGNFPAFGRTYVVFGAASLPAQIDVTSLNTLGITITGASDDDGAGRSVANAGDVNGDGFGDLIIGAADADGPGESRSSAGESYVIFGQNFTASVTIAGTSADDTLTGNASVNVINGGGGNDTLSGGGGADVIYGGQGNDILAISDTTFRRLDGGNGFDTVQFVGSGLTLNFATLGNSKLSNVEALDIRGSGVNSLILNAREVLAVTSNSNPSHNPNTLLVRRDADDVLDIGTGWIQVGFEVIDSVTYSVLKQNGATLKISNRPPVFTSGSTATVSENQTAVMTVTASDPDLPPQTITFSVTGGADQAKFSITSGGVLTFVVAPNFEIPSDAGTDNVYNVQVTANDGSGGLTTQNISVTVTNVNDAPVFVSSNTFSVAENTTAVSTTAATDADLPAQTVTYTITGGADQSKFTINSAGVLRFLTAPDFEIPTDVGANNVYNVQVTANDGHGGLTPQNIAVTVTAVNDNSPVFTSPAAVDSPENSTTVGSITATDADLPGQTLNFSISGGVDQALFSITSGGVLSFISAPDFENPADAGTNNIFDVQITVSDGQGRSNTLNVAIRVVPVNDNLPVFTSPTSFDVTENATAVGTMAATDGDLPSQSITYSITGGVDQSKFAITPAGILTFQSAPDFENPTDGNGDNNYQLQVTASDGLGGLTVQNLVVHVTPVNEAPVFASTSLQVNENTVTVGTIQVTDPDLLGQTVTLTITGGVDQARFVLSGNILSFNAPPDFELPADAGGNNVYNLQMTASDGVGGVTMQEIVVSVLAVNDNSPVFTSAATFHVPENTTSVGVTVATDADLPVQGITFSITGGVDQGRFSITAGGTLTFVSAPDFDLPGDSGADNVYNLQVTANDGNGRQTTQNISVIVDSANELPVFTSPAVFNVPENTAAVGAITVTDDDRPAQSISISISGGADQSRFTIDANGLLAFVTAPDFELPVDAGSDNVYKVVVSADDGNGGVTEQEITVIVTALNDNQPVFTSASAFDVAENTTPVGALTATDADLPGQSLTFIIIGGSDQSKFSLTASGVLQFIAPADFENPADVNRDNVYEVQVRVNDGAGGTQIQALSVTVTPVNEHAPVWISPSVVDVVENSTMVATLIATDADLPAQTVSYAITGGSDQSKFTLNGTVLQFITSPDYEAPQDVGTDNVYNVQVTANDGNGRLTVQSMVVTVTPANDNLSLFVSSPTFSVAENSTSVGTVIVTDADQPAQTLSFSISGGSDAAKFAITTVGVLTFVTAPDFENPVDAGANNVYNVQVTASDGQGGLTTQDISVTVTPTNDNAPLFTSPATFSVAENSVAVGNVSATDADRPSQGIILSITGGADRARFAMTAGGVLTFLAAPDFENPVDAGLNNVYDLQVTANDGSGGSTVQSIAVSVTPLNEAPAITSPAAFNVAENSTTVGTVIGSDSDLPSQSLNYSISGGADQSLFAINNTNGVLNFVTAPDFENPTDAGGNNVYNVRVSVNDGNGGLVTQDIVVTVTAVNDNAPVFTSPATFSVPENSTAVGTIAASDADVPGQALTYSLTGGADQGRFSITSGGVLSFKAAPDAEQPADNGLDNVYNVQVTANDANGRTSVQSIAVTVTGVNDNSPVFTSATTFNVTENDVTAGSVTASDADLPAQVLSYAITGGADQSRFSMTSIGGLTFVAAPDFENPSDADANNVYELQVTANDGSGGSTMRNILVTVSPINDNAPVFTSPAAFNVAENTTGIGTISASDADLPGQALTYSITGGADQARFTINNGALAFATAPNFESPADAGANNVYDLQVTASDGRGGTTVQNITVTVTPVNDQLPVFSSPATITVAENSTQVANIVATDADQPRQTISYSIVGGADQARFSITSGGVLTFLVPPDFETPSDQGANNGYVLQIRASDGQGGTTVQNVAVIVTDVDEIAPTATIDPVIPNLRNSAVDIITIRFSERVTGFDVGDMRLTRNGGANLLNGTETLTTADGATYTLSGLSAFTSPDGGYRLTLVGPGSQIVDVANVEYAEAGQDSSWIVDSTPPTATISSVSPDPRAISVGSLTITFSEPVSGFGVNDLALTRDGGPNLLTGFESLTSSDSTTFTLDDLGTLTSSTGAYTLTLKANLSGIQDLAGNPLSSNVNEGWTRINPTVSLSIDNSALPESAGSATVTATLSSPTDVNVTIALGFAGTSTSPGDYGRTGAQIVIPAGSQTGSIVLTTTQDGEFESTESVVVEIVNVINAVEDGKQQVTAQITDDDHAPVFTTIAVPVVTENTQAVMTVLATDADLPAQTITYSISGGTDGELFTITASGELTFIANPNFELPADADADNTYQVRVTASDGHGGSTSQDIVVTVTNVDEAPHLELGGSDVTWIKRQPPVTVLPQLTVGGPSPVGGTLTVSTNVVGTPKKLLDLFTFPASSIGTTSGPQRSGNTLTLMIQLKQNVTNAEIQAYLRAITFATKGKGLKTLTRNVQVTLADSVGTSSSVSQTINVRKK